MAWWEGFDETRILIAPDTSTSGEHDGQFLSLRHPKSGDKTCYLYSNGALNEIHWFKQTYGSWFLGDYVCEDGRLYTATPVDPVFVLLPIFEEARIKKGNDPGMFRQLDEIVYVHGYPGYHSLASIAEKTMQVVCDVKEVGSTKFFRLNDEKVQNWLCYKVHQLGKTLPMLDKNYAARDEKNRCEIPSRLTIDFSTSESTSKRVHHCFSRECYQIHSTKHIAQSGHFGKVFIWSVLCPADLY